MIKPLAQSIVLAAGIASILAVPGQALARDHSRHGHGEGGRSSVRIGFGYSDCGSGISVGFGTGFRSYDCGPRYSYSYCAPRYYSPVIVSRPYYAPVVYSYPRTVYVSPQVVTQPVVVQQPIVVQAQPPEQAAVQQPVTIQPSMASASAPQVTTQSAQDAEQGRYQDRELGDAYMRMNDPDNAARVYKRYLSVWSGDGTVTRNLGFAQIDRGEVQDGFRSVAKGYSLEKDLIKRPIRMEDLGGKIGFERLLDAAAKGAAGMNTPEGWLTVAILQHTGGQREATVSALQHAKEAGLAQDTMDMFALEIGKPSK